MDPLSLVFSSALCAKEKSSGTSMPGETATGKRVLALVRIRPIAKAAVSESCSREKKILDFENAKSEVSSKELRDEMVFIDHVSSEYHRNWLLQRL